MQQEIGVQKVSQLVIYYVCALLTKINRQLLIHLALILNIETSTPICSVCLSRNGVVLDIREDRVGNSHARILTVFISQLMEKTNIGLAELDAVAISAGPGSYTGLRIGTSVAKGLCFALNKPLIAVSTLQALAKGMIEKPNDQLALLMPVIDARRMDVYTALFDANCQQLQSPAIKTLDKLYERLIVEHAKTVYVGGNAAFKCREVFNVPTIKFLDNVDCSARLVGILAQEMFNAGKFENPAYYEPDYLKEFEGRKKT